MMMIDEAPTSLSPFPSPSPPPSPPPPLTPPLTPPRPTSTPSTHCNVRPPRTHPLHVCALSTQTRRWGRRAAAGQRRRNCTSQGSRPGIPTCLVPTVWGGFRGVWRGPTSRAGLMPSLFASLSSPQGLSDHALLSCCCSCCRAMHPCVPALLRSSLHACN